MRKIFIYCLCLWPVLGNAQIQDTFLFIDSVVISSPRISVPFNREMRSIEVISKNEIANLPVRDIQGILQFAAGVDIRQRGPMGVQADIGIRGGSFEQTLLLINGIKVTDPQTGHHIMNIPVRPENIERIEIIKGPAARIYGQNAFAGAVNIVTKNVEDFGVDLNTQVGQNQLLGLGLNFSLPGKRTMQQFSIHRQVSEGYRYNTDFDISNILYQNQIQWRDREISLLAGFTERRFGANGFYASPAFRDQYEEIQTSLVALQTKIIKGNWIHSPRAYWRRNQDEYIFVRSNPSLYRNLHIGNNIGLEWNTTYSGNWGITGLGAEVRKETLVSNNLGNRNRNLVSAYLEQRMDYGIFSITPGLSFQYYSDFGPRLFYGIDAGLQLNQVMSLYANAGTTYRVPSYTDRFYEDPANLGNPDLAPETALTYEIGIKSGLRNLSFQSALFHRIGNNMIDWVRDTLVSSQWMPVNLNRIPTTGFEISLSSNLGYATGIKLLGYHRLNYTYLNAQIINESEGESRYLLENLRHQFSTASTFDLYYLEATLTFRYLERVSLPNYRLVDIRLQKKWRNNEVFVDINNLFDTAYRETNLVEMPGRWIVLGGRFNIY